MNKTSGNPPLESDAFPFLAEGLLKLDLSGGDTFFSLLAHYIEEIELFNAAYGLVKVQDRRELIIKHILDSLAPITILRDLLDKQTRVKEKGKPRIADIGSGAGLPGIPLAICMPDAEFTLVERMGRRAGFLRDALAMLGLSNVTIEENEMEKFARLSSGKGCFDLVVFRAFKPLERDILKKLLSFLAPGAFLAAYKGRRETIEAEMDKLITACGEEQGSSINFDIIQLEVPFLEEERHLLIIRS